MSRPDVTPELLEWANARAGRYAVVYGDADGRFACSVGASLASAVRRYSPARGPFLPYARQQVAMGLKQVLRRRGPAPVYIEEHRGEFADAAAGRAQSLTDDRLDLAGLLGRLPPRNRDMVLSYYGIGRPAERPGEIGPRHGLKRMRVQQIVAESVGMMRRWAG